MDDAFKKQADEWYERGRHDIESAQLLYDERGYTDTIAFHIHRALEKYLKGFLVLHGKKPPKLHEPDTLLHHAADFDKRLTEYLELCERASRFYLSDRYPPGPPVVYEYAEVKLYLDLALELIQRILENRTL